MGMLDPSPPDVRSAASEEAKPTSEAAARACWTAASVSWLARRAASNAFKPGEEKVCEQRPDRYLDGRKDSPTREGLLTLKFFELEKPESWPEGQTLILDDTNTECANAQNQDPDCDNDRAEEQIPFSDRAHMRSPSDGWRVRGE
jgi:hypothetical protein